MKNWLKLHPHVQVMYLPPYSPNLNPIERTAAHNVGNCSKRKKLIHFGMRVLMISNKR
ncbi:transposase [Rhodoflexus sp.]